MAQKKASAAEMAAVHAQSKAAKEEQKASSAYLEAKARLEKAQANLRVCEERLTLTKGNAEKTTALVRRQVGLSILDCSYMTNAVPSGRGR